MCWEEAGLLGQLIHHISSPRPQGRSAIGSSPKPEYDQAIFPHRFPSSLGGQVRTGELPSFDFGDQAAGRGNGPDLMGLGFICFQTVGSRNRRRFPQITEHVHFAVGEFT